MKFNLIRTFLVLTTGGYFLYYYIGTFEDDSFIDGIVLAILMLIFGGSVIYGFFIDRKTHNTTKSYISYIPTIAGILIVSAICIASYLLIKRDSSPIILQAGYDGGFNGSWFEFREDGTYKFANSGGIGATYIRGTYKVEDSIITIDKSNLDKVIITKYLAIRKRDIDSSFQKLHPEIPTKALYQINKNHEVVDKECIFVINQDLRKH